MTEPNKLPFVYEIPLFNAKKTRDSLIIAFMLKSIKSYSLEELSQTMEDLGQPRFRAEQLAQWLYVHHVSSFDEMTNLSKALRAELAEKYSLPVASILDKQVSADGTRKYILRFADGECVETVAIPSSSSEEGSQKRLTVCFSTQVGCSLECSFCATGREGFTRNLAVGEMVDQILMAQEDFGQRVSNVVAMGQGEPFLNYKNTLAALRIINHPKLLKIGARRITVSTCGILDGIDRFATVPEQFTLAVSLHSARQSIRNAIMPRMEKQPLRQLQAALINYLEKTDRRITLEYLLIKDLNDGEEDLQALVRFCDGLLCHVNLLPLNPVASTWFQPSSQATVRRWLQELENHRIETTFRQSRGEDITGACGQLKNTFS